MSEMRYEDAPNYVTRIVKQQIKKHFPVLQEFNVKVVLDTKGMKSKGRRIFGKLKKADDLNRFLTQSEETAFQGYHFIMILDKVLVTTQPKSDTKRVTFHELNHGGMDDKGKPVIIDHDFEGFYIEIDYNDDDPRWKERLSTQLAQAYGDEE